jgi:hypothetical protein
MQALYLPLQVLLWPLHALSRTLQTFSRPQQHSHCREEVLANCLLQAKRALVDCRGIESALEAVRVSLEAKRVSIEALRCCRGSKRLEEVPENVN